MRPVYLHLPHTPRIGILELLESYYGKSRVFAPQEVETEMVRCLLERPELYDNDEAFWGPFRRDDFQSFGGNDLTFFSAVCDPVVRAWQEFVTLPPQLGARKRITFEEWLVTKSVPNVLCWHFTGLKDANEADFQATVRLTNFVVCAFDKAPAMIDALGRLLGWNSHSLPEEARLTLPPIPIPLLEPPVLPGNARELVETYHHRDCAAYRWISTRHYTF